MDAEELSDLMGDTQLPAWATMPDFERTKWMNRMIRQIYPHLARMVSTWANENVDTLLKENAPGWVRSIRMTHFSMGSSAPQVTGVKVRPAGTA